MKQKQTLAEFEADAQRRHEARMLDERGRREANSEEAEAYVARVMEELTRLRAEQEPDFEREPDPVRYHRSTRTFAGTPDQPIDAAKLGAALAEGAQHMAYRVTVEIWDRA